MVGVFQLRRRKEIRLRYGMIVVAMFGYLWAVVFVGGTRIGFAWDCFTSIDIRVHTSESTSSNLKVKNV